MKHVQVIGVEKHIHDFNHEVGVAAYRGSQALDTTFFDEMVSNELSESEIGNMILEQVIQPLVLTETIDKGRVYALSEGLLTVSYYEFGLESEGVVSTEDIPELIAQDAPIYYCVYTIAVLIDGIRLSQEKLFRGLGFCPK